MIQRGVQERDRERAWDSKHRSFPPLDRCCLAAVRIASGPSSGRTWASCRVCLEALCPKACWLRPGAEPTAAAECSTGDVLLADRGFCADGLIGVLLARGVDWVLRLHHRRPHDMQQGTPLGEGDRLVAWTRPPAPRRSDPWAAERSTLPASLAVRLVSFRVEVPGFRTEAITLATTLLDAKQYPAHALAELYRARWNIELRYREIKITMGADVLRCKSPAMIQKELCLHAIAYNLLRCVMQQAAQRHDVRLGRLSFKGTLDAVRHFADALHAASGQPRLRSQIYEQLLGLLAKDTLPLRPDRHEPRARKRRPKQYQLLNQPRRLMRAIPHKNRHRATDPSGLN